MDVPVAPNASVLTESLLTAHLLPPEHRSPATVTVSIVSHEHDRLIEKLMAQLCEVHGGLIAHVVLTHNLRAVPVPTPAEGWPFKLTQVFNETPAGFGANHNRAFELCRSSYFCVLNPDIELCDPSVWPRQPAGERAGSRHSVRPGAAACA
jgi:hypothetical protein